MTLSWPADHMGWRLEVQTNQLSTGLSANWVEVPGSSSMTNVTVPVSSTNGAVFYRPDNAGRAMTNAREPGGVSLGYSLRRA